MRIQKIVTRKEAQAKAFGEADNEFVNQVTPDVSLSTELMGKESWTDVTKVWPCELRYRIDLDLRRWGVAGASLSLDEAPIAVRIETTTETGPDGTSKAVDETKTVLVDPSRIRVDLRPGESISLFGLDLHLNPDFTVDYDNSAVSGSTLMGAGE